ncbi:SDR family oxidoreductase [Halobacterium sp. KA-4]|uniref:SDR family NAD(P)-dependent oxidoreductase n=1 Tax=Halobacterium sp. KA-4 TaxID=2896367 RepID=UPI001E321461|nr:SDR family oxidoreductase [Halobacterium sp. KA-4]MCD2201688.1 SDR family oxidoreductase [Halobacterium sp. KA-4]
MAELLTGKTAVVTGAASGIGRGISLALAREGADVVVADLRETPRTEDTTPTVEAIHERTDADAEYVECDVTDYESVENAVDVAEERGGIDIMVNNAGITHGPTFLETDEEDYYDITDVNLKGVYFGCRAAGERMVANGSGSIINVSSTAANQGFDEPGAAFYCATKGGVKSLTFALGEILGPEVRVNAIQPGFTAGTGLAADNHDEEAERARAAETALDRLGTPEDLGNAAVFFASDLSSYITSEALLVDGGWVNVGGP